MSTLDAFSIENRRLLTLRKGRENAVGNRHPWIFGGAIASERGPEEAAIADLVDADGRVLASGFHSLHSQIRLRALTFGSGLTRQIVEQRIRAAVARRRSLLDGATTAARLIHSEGDELSGLIVDRYDDMLVVEITNQGLDRLTPLIVDILRQETAPRGIFFQHDLPARKIEQLSTDPKWEGEGEPAATISENGLRFHIDPKQGQKTGFFLDQRENRQLVRDAASGRRVLNLFSYSGAFGVYAAAGGASQVTDVDVSAPAIELARRNHELNGTTAEQVVADAFSFVRQKAAGGPQFDLVVCDPPAFAKSRRDIDRAARGYKDINLYALKLIAPGGLLMTFSCSGHMSLDLFQKVIFAAAIDAGRRVAVLRRLTAGPDHPVSLYCPEGEYLKGFLLEVREN